MQVWAAAGGLRKQQTKTCNKLMKTPNRTALLPMNLNMPLLIINNLRISRFKGTRRALVRGILSLTVGVVLLASLQPATAASAVVFVKTANGWAHDYGLGQTTAAAARAAKLKLIQRGYSVWIAFTMSSGVNGYGAVVGDSKDGGFFGAEAGAPTLAAAVSVATARAVQNGAKATKVLSSWADITLTEPRTISPAANQTGVHRPTTFTWAGVPYAGNYELQIEYVSSTGSVSVVDLATVSGQTYTSMKLGPGRNYRWKVRAISEEGSVRSPWSPYSRFATRITG